MAKGTEQLPSGRWRVRWWERGKRVSRSFPTEADAEEFRGAALAAVAKGHTIAHLRPAVLMDSARLNLDATGCYVYVLCGAKGEPIYVGRSSNVFGRIGQHMQIRERRSAIKGVSLIPCDSVAETKVVEMALIKLYRPPLNVYGLVPKKPRVLSRRERFVRAERERRRRRELRGHILPRKPPSSG